MKKVLLIFIIFFFSGLNYAEEIKVARIGKKAPDFTVNAYFPTKNKFGKVTLSELTNKGNMWGNFD